MQFQYSMEHLQLPLFCFLTFFIFLTSFLAFNKRGRESSRRVPGPWMLPIIGSIHHLLVGSELPHRRLCALALRYGPDLMHMRLGQVDTVIVSSPAAAQELWRTHDVNFSSRPRLGALEMLTYGYTTITFSSYGSYWRQLKKICVTELLTAKRVKSFGSLREEEILNLVKEIEISASSGEPVNIGHKLKSLTNTIVFRAMLGKKCRQQDEFFSILKEGSQLIMNATVFDFFPSLKFLEVLNGTRSSLKRLHESVDGILEEIVQEHEKVLPSKDIGNEEDMLDVLLRLKDSGELEVPLTRDNIKAVVSDLLGAGTDTSSGTMEWAMAELMKNPKVMHKAQREVRQALEGKTKLEESDVANLKYLKLVIKETLRLHPPVPLVPRQCTEGCQIQGYSIPSGTRIFLNQWALGRDPEHWEDADQFRPERFDGSSIDYSYLPFGAGRRMCIGMTFAVAIMEFTLAYLLNYFDWELPGGIKAEELDMSEDFSAVVSLKSELHLVASIYVP